VQGPSTEGIEGRSGEGEARRKGINNHQPITTAAAATAAAGEEGYATEAEVKEWKGQRGGREGGREGGKEGGRGGELEGAHAPIDFGGEASYVVAVDG